MFMIVLDPVYKPKETSKNELERKYEIIYAEGNISNMDYVVEGQVRVNQRRPVGENPSKFEKSPSPGKSAISDKIAEKLSESPKIKTFIPG